MNRFTKSNWKKNLISHFPLSILVFAIILVGFVYGTSKVTESDVMNERQILENAIRRDIVHCYAVEGNYPESLAYMEEHYGLIYNKDKYLIHYENVGGNIMPNITIIER